MINIDTKKHLMTFECCRIVKGHTKSIFYDLQRSTNRFIPNDLADLLLTHQTETLENICSYYPSEYHNTILDNISTLIEEEYIFLTDTPEKFPKLSLQWDEPSKISNAIIEYGNWISEINLDVTYSELCSLGCKHLEVRIYKPLPFSTLIGFINGIYESKFASIEIISHIPDNFVLNKFVEETQEISELRILLFNADRSLTINNKKSEIGKIEFTTESLDNRIHCGKIGPNSFVVNIKMFTEAVQHNLCLNRKISIDTEGNIKNCPSMNDSYGNIIDTSLIEAVDKEDFRKYWNISKDMIVGCKDCEFRYMCHDCRAYTEDPSNALGPQKTNLSKPLKCGYDPYSGTWTKWSTNPLKHKAIEHYKMKELSLIPN